MRFKYEYWFALFSLYIFIGIYDSVADATLSNIQLHSYATSHNTEYHPYAISHNTKISSVLRLGEDHPCALYGLTGRLQYSQ